MATDREQVCNTDRPEPHWILALVVGLAAFMQSVDFFIANIALVRIARDFSASEYEATWILTAYLLCTAISLPMSGWISSKIGRKRFFLASILGFGCSSLLCGLARNLAMLVAFRALQGLAGGGLLPVSQAVLNDSFPPVKRGKAVAIYGIGVVLAPAVGPVMGGWITETFSWPWIFLANLPVCGLSFYAVFSLVPKEARQVGSAIRQLDWIGIALLIVGWGSLQLVLQGGRMHLWNFSDLVVTLWVAAAGGLALFVRRELRSNDPILNVGLFADKHFAVGSLLMFVLNFVLAASTLLLPQYVQILLGFSVLKAGMILSCGGIVIVLCTPFVIRFAGLVDARYLLFLGFVICAFGLFGMSQFDQSVDETSIVGYRMLQSFGIAFLFAPIHAIALTSLRNEKNDCAFTLLHVSRTLGSSVGIASAAAFIVHRTSRYLEVHGYGRLAEEPASLGALLDAYRDAFLCLVVLMLCIAPLAFIVGRSPGRRSSTAIAPRREIQVGDSIKRIGAGGTSEMEKSA